MIPPLSTSEEHGLAAIPKDALSIYSVGVSTAGSAEIRMAQENPRRHIIATTIDKNGAADSQKIIGQQGLSNRIEVKVEDVTQKLPYVDNTFDYIYARLVLHYLTRRQLQSALAELYRTLKPGCALFTVVRSTKNLDATERASEYDEDTGMTTYTSRPNNSTSEVRRRFFHTQESITRFLTYANFKISHKEQYEERLFHDYGRTIPVEYADNLLEVIAIK